MGQRDVGTIYRNDEQLIDITWLGNIPGYVANGYYYVGAIVTVNGIEDLVTENNRFFLYSASGSPNKPNGALKISRSGSAAPQPTPNPEPTPGPSTVDEVLDGGTVRLFTNGMNGNYLYQGRVYEPTWKRLTFGSSAPAGELNFRLTAPPGEYVFATAFVNARTGEFIRTDEPVENTDTFRVD